MRIWMHVIVCTGKVAEGLINAEIQWMLLCLKCSACVLAGTEKSLVKLIASPFGKDYAQLRVRPTNRVSDS